AHEINTPTQYIGDNVRFLKDAFQELGAPLQAVASLATTEPKNGSDALSVIQTSLEDVDLQYLQEEIPVAIEQTLDGIAKVAKIVLAMKEFSHPGSEEKTFIDLNKIIESVVTVAKNEWKYVAEVELDLDPKLPQVPCFPNELNQVILNIVVNAAQAIGAELEGEAKGKIMVKTGFDEEWAKIEISDTGPGIPKDYITKIFDPFFTTKEVGKGTGQGLSICYASIVEKHAGTLNVETEIGKGSTFFIQIPLSMNSSCK
ncbi:sensor histidine kinase, partial [Oligoflexia bacterium]|nr:sensor histidine kinase [Oligoflexia bacterium]